MVASHVSMAKVGMQGLFAPFYNPKDCAGVVGGGSWAQVSRHDRSKLQLSVRVASTCSGPCFQRWSLHLSFKSQAADGSVPAGFRAAGGWCADWTAFSAQVFLETLHQRYANAPPSHLPLLHTSSICLQQQRQQSENWKGLSRGHRVRKKGLRIRVTSAALRVTCCPAGVGHGGARGGRACMRQQ